MKHAYLCGKGRSLDNVTIGWFDADSPVWCLNQSATVIRRLLPDREIHCVLNDPWIHYAPPEDVIWHCRSIVDTKGRPAEKYYPEALTGHWADPTCMCALQLLRNRGYDSITMIGFDSHFDGSRTYADCLKVKSDEIAPMHFYDTLMRKWARRNGVSLTWVDSKGVGHRDDFRFRKTLVAVSIGEKYNKQTERMCARFQELNPDWDTCHFYDEGLTSLLPVPCHDWSAFNRCELGRWHAMKKCLEDRYDTVVYADGDICWYAPYEESIEHDIVLYPHYVTKRGSQDRKHWVEHDGTANIGIMELNRSIDHDRIFNLVIGEVLHDTPRYKHKEQLWLQPLVSCLHDCGFDAVYNLDPGHDVARWNLHSDRQVLRRDGQYIVRASDGRESPLKSFHFSSKSIASLPKYGDVVRQLLEDYYDEQ